MSFNFLSETDGQKLGKRELFTMSKISSSLIGHILPTKSELSV